MILPSYHEWYLVIHQAVFDLVLCGNSPWPAVMFVCPPRGN